MAKTQISDSVWGSQNFSMGFTSTSSKTMFQAINLYNFQEN